MADATYWVPPPRARISISRTRTFAHKPPTLGTRDGDSASYHAGAQPRSRLAQADSLNFGGCMSGVDIRIGTSGFHYKHWCGPFYPKRLPASRMLDHYLEHFDTVELNNSFY